MRSRARETDGDARGRARIAGVNAMFYRRFVDDLRRGAGSVRGERRWRAFGCGRPARIRRNHATDDDDDGANRWCESRW